MTQFFTTIAVLTADPIAVWGLIVAIIGVVIGLVAAVAAIYAAVYAKAAPTKEDLARVEQNTLESSQHLMNVHANLARTEELNALTSVAERVSLRVSGDSQVTGPLTLRLWLANLGVILTRVVLLNDKGIQCGECDCKQTEPLMYEITLGEETFQRWFNAGTVDGSGNRMLLTMRVYMTIEGKQEVNKIVPLYMNQDLRQEHPNNVYAYHCGA